jgi:AraC family transcriptional regulator of adaptative response/methylated-DNA-[protein]-cysteine methyltransferase
MQSDYLRIERAIRYLEENMTDQPDLEQLADQVHLSPFHFQRLFSRWAGISPKRFLQFLTVEHAKEQLRRQRSVLDVAYDTGLSSPSRLYDAFITVEAVTPGEYKNRGAGLIIRYGVHTSPFGQCFLATTERGICWLSFVAEGEEADAISELGKRWEGAVLEEDPAATGPFIRRIFEKKGTPIRLFLKGTNFQIKVWEALLRIPPGHITTYEDVARRIGRDTAARAVGNAVAANPVAYLIPCHRVIRKVGIFGNYQFGSVRKKMMIGREMAAAHSQQDHRIGENSKTSILTKK